MQLRELFTAQASTPVSIPTLVITPTPTQLFMFSAITWNRHRIHFDKDAAIEEGHEGVVVHRALLGNFFSRLLTEWLGDYGRIAELSWRVISSARPGEALQCGGEVTAIERPAEREAHLRCELRIRNASGAMLATGKATCVVTNSSADGMATLGVNDRG